MVPKRIAEVPEPNGRLRAGRGTDGSTLSDVVRFAALGLAFGTAIGMANASPLTVTTVTPHVMLIVEENRSESSVIGSSDAPYINSLADTYGLALSSYGQAHPSLPNYLELLSGSTHGVTDDGTGYTFAGPTLVDQLAQQGITWRAEMESMPSACYSGGSAGEYAKKHDPFMYFRTITQNASQCQNVVPLRSLQTDVSSAQAADFVWVTPNLCDDGHDCSTGTADSWLQTNLGPVLSSSWFRENGVVIITWDEGSDNSGCCGSAYGGHIATIVVAANQQAHTTLAQAVDHAGTLRTIEQLYGVPPLGDAACVCSGDLTPLLPAAQPAPSPIPSLTWLTVPHLR